MRDAVTQTPICVPDSGDEMQMSSDVNTSVDDQTDVGSGPNVVTTLNDNATSDDVFCTSHDHARPCDNIVQLPVGYTYFHDVISPSIDVCQTSLSDAF